MKKCITTTILLTTFGCSSFENLHRKPSSILENEKSCNELVLDFGVSHLSITSSKYEKFNKFHNSINFISEERKLENSIQEWMRIGQRSISVEQMRHHGAFSKIASSFDLDTPYIISKNFEGLYKQIETSYFISKRFLSKAKELHSLKDLIKNATEIDQALIDKINRLNADLIIDQEKLSTLELETLKTQFTQYEDKINTTIIEESVRILKSFEQYKVTREFLDKKLLSPDDSQKAKTILEKLETSKILASCDICSDDQILTRPKISQIEEIINSVKIAKIIYLKKQLFSERIMSISSRLPNNALYYIVDIILQKIPKLNKSDFRKFLRSKVIDFRDVTKHFPNIDRIIFSKAEIEELTTLTRDIAAQSNDLDFLITFARRVDSHDKWNLVINHLRKTATEKEEKHLDRILLSNMEKAWIEATNRGPLPEWHAPERSNAIRFIIDTIFLGYVSYTGMELVDSGLDEVEDITGIDLRKEEEIMDSIDEQTKKLESMIESEYNPFEENNANKEEINFPEETPQETIKSNKNLFEM